jgi:hypothetical protein
MHPNQETSSINWFNSLLAIPPAFISSLLIGGVAAAASAAFGATGAGIMRAAGHSNYDAMEAAKMGAAGGAVLTGGLTFAAVYIEKSGLFSKQKNNVDSTSSNDKKTALLAGSLLVLPVLNGLVGYGLLNVGEHKTQMNLGETSAAFGTGTAVISGSILCGALCCVGAFLHGVLNNPPLYRC